MSFRWPLDGTITINQGFGGNAEYYKSVGQIGHNGLDLKAPAGTPVYAADEGTISFEGWGQNHSWMGKPAGICIIIDHIGSYAGYAHLKSTFVNKGQKVVKGQLIGYSGSTGKATGPHLHWEMLPKSPNFKNGYAGRINIVPFIEATPTVTKATEAEIRQAFQEILERAAEPSALTHYKQYPVAFVRQDLANSAEKRTLEARKAEAARVAAVRAAEDAARLIEDAKKASEAKAALEAAQKAADELAAAEAEKARIVELERIAREAAETKAKEQQAIEEASKGGKMTTFEELDKLGSDDKATTVTRGEATKSASLFVARVYTQYLAGQIIAAGIAAILYEALHWAASDSAIGIASLIIAGVFIFWGQFGYRLAQDAGWKWAANLKWPF